jgi:integrase
MARRGAGEGSIYKRADGLWAGDVQLGVDENGKRRRRTVYGATQAKVLEKVAELRARSATAPWVEDAGGLRLGEYLTKWLDDVAAPRVRSGTLHYYERMLRPARESCGGIQLRSLSPLHVQSMLRRLEQGGASARGRQMTYTVLRTALRDAVRLRLLAANPLDAVSRPRAPRPEIRALSTAEARKLLTAAKGDPLEALYALAVGTGLRFGEAVALRWADVDLGAGTVHVRRTAIEARGGAVTFAEPKTSRSRRQVDLPAFVVAALERHRALVGATPHPERLVFMSPDELPLRRSNLHRRSWKPLLERAKLPHVPFHALRHTAATLALAAGVNPKVVQERLGHSSIALTLDTYSHAVPTLGRDAAARLDAVLR